MVLPAVNTPPAYLEECLASILEQDHGDWELCIVVDAPSSIECAKILRRHARRDNRIRSTGRVGNGGIAVAANDGLAMARGEFVAFVDHDDLLDRRCVGRVLEAINAHDDVDVVYTDEVILLPDGSTIPAKKPDWSPERLRSQNYICYLAVYRTSLLRELDGVRVDMEGSWDYDLVLRATERARRVVHIPEILYTRRVNVEAHSDSDGTGEAALEAGRRAVEEHCARVGIDAVVEHSDVLGVHRVRRTLASEPLVSVVIPTRGTESFVDGRRVVLVENCIRTILTRSTYSNFEFVVVADVDTPPAVLEGLEALGRERLTVITYDKPFNFSDKCNRGVLASTGEVVLLLSDDTEILDPDWCEAMVSLVLELRVGAVGCLLFFAGLRVQHGGHIYNAGAPTHEGMGMPIGHEGVYRNVCTQREVSGVTGAALMIRREVFIEVGGLSNRFPNNFNDVDLCLKVRDAGYTNLYTPYARMYHFESITRGRNVDIAEHHAILDRWWRELHRDPFTASAPVFHKVLTSPLSGSTNQ